jgi:hypothetical protein
MDLYELWILSLPQRQNFMLQQAQCSHAANLALAMHARFTCDEDLKLAVTLLVIALAAA